MSHAQPTPRGAIGGIASAGELLAIVEDARRGGRLALDTEFMGEGRYRTLLCLIQLASPLTATGNEPRVALLDPLQDGIDMAPLRHVLADPVVEIVVHAGRQDVALLRRMLDTEVHTIFDTQVAAGFVGMPAQSSYESLLMGLLGIKVAKSASFTRWDARPLSVEQLAYAREDVVHLLELSAELQRRLREAGRLEWARQECEPLESSSDERDPASIFARLPRIRSLAPPSRSLARELVDWRERTAAHRDRTVQSVMGDAVLVEIAKRRPSTTRQLGEIRGLGGGLLHRMAPELLQVILDAQRRSSEPLPPGGNTNLSDPADPPFIALCEALVRGRTREARLAYELLATRAELQAIVASRRLGAAEPDVRTLRGWRRELVGEELLRLLDGDLALSVGDSRLHVGPVAAHRPHTDS